MDGKTLKLSYTVMPLPWEQLRPFGNLYVAYRDADTPSGEGKPWTIYASWVGNDKALFEQWFKKRFKQTACVFVPKAPLLENEVTSYLKTKHTTGNVGWGVNKDGSAIKSGIRPVRITFEMDVISGTKAVGISSFSKQVLEVLLTIPPGETRSYSWVADQIQHSKAARAVGRALANNPFILLVPCHRIIREDGQLGGYVLSVSFKKALLEVERLRNCI
ncbi:MAG: MGMT family protein [Actinobacteria bacterium]|nr:MGMT family protein [Actinomycetota bacterium]MCL6104520.1 MGMT family protein [Actinomycetota bacterium]